MKPAKRIRTPSRPRLRELFCIGVDAYLNSLKHHPDGWARKLGAQSDLIEEYDAAFQAGAAWAKARYGTRDEIEAAANKGVP